MIDVIIVGSANLDLVATTQRIPAPGETVLGYAYAEHPGGKGLNQAVAAARAGARVAMIGAVGDDAAGTTLRAVAADEGIDVEALAIVPGVPTGRALITVDDSAENSIVVIPGANGHVVAPADALPPATVVLAQLEVPLGEVVTALTAAHASGATTVLNPAPAAVLPTELLATCDIVIPNEHELALLGGVDALLAQGLGAVVVTLGAAGVEVTTADGEHWHQAAFAVTPVDTTGAGDAFCGNLAARLAAGDDLLDAVRWAAAAGALATTRAGAVPSMPTRAQTQALLNPPTAE